MGEVTDKHTNKHRRQNIAADVHRPATLTRCISIIQKVKLINLGMERRVRE